MLSDGITRRNLIKGAGAAAASALGGPALARAAEAPPARAKRPNILLYVVDDQGTGDAGCYGNPAIRTPGLDELAAGGVRFTNAYSTTASCSASRSVILTGLYNHRNGQYGHQHRYHHFITFPWVRSLPNLLGEAGYRTARWGKYHVAPEAVYRFETVIRGGGSPAAGAERCRDLIAADDNRPFFLYFGTTEPHRPFKRDGSDPVDPKDVIVPPYLPDIPECRQELAKYYMSVQRADAGLVRLIRLLKDTGRWHDTVVLYCSDNGIAFPGAKTNAYEPALRLPFVVRDPFGGPQGSVCEAILNYTCITPTLLDVAGAVPEGYAFHGRSFRRAMRERRPEGWDETYASHTFHEITMYYPMRVVRDRRWKLIWNLAHPLAYPFASDLYASATWQAVLERGLKTYGKRPVEAYLHRPAFELYDLENDPHEATNLADDPAHAATLERLQAKLQAMQKRTKDPWIVKWTYE